jgi:DNA-binding YbaB/EbfC family protein
MGGFNPKQLQEMMMRAREQSEALQQKMAETIVEASAGGGAVSIRMNGQKHLVSVTIDPETIKSGDVEMLQDLVLAAVNEAARKADEAMQSSVGGMLGAMGLPGGLF